MDIYGVIQADVYGLLGGRIWSERDGYGGLQDSCGEIEDGYGRLTPK